MESPKIEQRIASWLAETVAVDDDACVAWSPTIVPESRPKGSAGEGTSASATAPTVAGGQELDEMPAVGELLAGGSLDSVEIGEVIGEGGRGVIRSAVQVSLHREVAVKMLKSQASDPAGAVELLREAWVIGGLEHPNVVPVYAVTLDRDRRPVIVLKKIEGTTWARLMFDDAEIERRFASIDRTEWNLRILLQVMDTMRFAHSRGILHRDLKPANVMIGEFGEVYVLDWGLAVSVREGEDGRVPLAKDVVDLAGTPCYMAPEMLSPGEVALSERTDVYLLGAILYEILHRRPPHDGASASEILESVRRSEPDFADGGPAELGRIAAVAMARSPVDRWQSVDAMRRALHEHLQRRGAVALTARASAELERLEVTVASVASDSPRARVYNLFGQCRFGFFEALAQWPGDPQAEHGLRRATETMVRYELDRGDAAAADALAAEHGDIDPALRSRIDAALAVESAAAVEVARLRRRADRRLGGGSRRVLFGLLGVFWALVPALIEVTASVSYAVHWISHGAFLALWVSIGLVGRSWVASTSLNRRIFLIVLGAVLLAMVSTAGSRWSGVSPELAQVQHLFVFLCAGLVAALTVEIWLWPTVVGYLMAFLVAARKPDVTLVAMALSNALMAVNTLIIWRNPPAGAAEDG